LKNNDTDEQPNQERKCHLWARISWLICYPIGKLCQRHPDQKDEKPQDRAARITANATVAVACLTFVLGAVGFMQWWELSGQLVAIRADQRPYIWLTNDLPPPVFLGDHSNGQVAWSWKFTNYGKSVAKNFRFHQFIKVGNGQYKVSYREPDTIYGGDVVPGKINFATGISAPGVVLDNVNQLLKMDRALGLLVELEYLDGYGTRYEDAFCVENLATGAISFADPKDCEKEKH
jgi:hypothetical protein